MKSAAFRYTAAASIDDAVAALAGAGTVKLLAGGQSLGPMLNLRLARADSLIDVSRVAALGVVEEHDDHWYLGACVTHARIEDEALSWRGVEALAPVAAGIAYRAVRNRGTIGGSLVHADPAADWPLALAALGASVEIAGRGRRSVPAGAFMRGAFSTVLTAGEMVIGIKVPKLSADARFGYFKYCRKTGEFAEISAAALFDPARKVARIFAGALDGAPRSLPGLAAQIARQPEVVADDGRLTTVIDQSDAASLGHHAVAVKRALKDALIHGH